TGPNTTRSVSFSVASLHSSAPAAARWETDPAVRLRTRQLGCPANEPKAPRACRISRRTFRGRQKRGTNSALRPFGFAKYKRPHFEDRNLTSDSAAMRDVAEMRTEDLGDLLGRVSETSTTQIDNLVGDFGRLREKMRVDGERIQRDIEEYRALS